MHNYINKTQKNIMEITTAAATPHGGKAFPHLCVVIFPFCLSQAILNPFKLTSYYLHPLRFVAPVVRPASLFNPLLPLPHRFLWRYQADGFTLFTGELTHATSIKAHSLFKLWHPLHVKCPPIKQHAFSPSPASLVSKLDVKDSSETWIHRDVIVLSYEILERYSTAGRETQLFSSRPRRGLPGG